MKNNQGRNKLLLLLSIFSIFSLLFSPAVFAPAATYAANSGLFPGDLNGDGAVNVLDLTLLKLILLGELEPIQTPSLDENSDVDQNGIINVIDNDALIVLIFGAIHELGGGGGGGGGGGSNPTLTPMPTPAPTTPPVTWYRDADGDGYGDPDSPMQPGTEPSGYVTDNTDCNDSNPVVNPGAAEVCDGIDNNCNGQVDEGSPDTDKDGIADCVDPDDDGDGVNDGSDCAPLDGTKWQTLTGYVDADGDGYGTGSSVGVCSGSELPVGYAPVSGDCNDTNANVHPGVMEIVNGIDDNCDGSIDVIDSSLHHLGDGEYSGAVNSQFQMQTEGTAYSRSFTAGSLQLYTKATLTITHRGVQKADPIKINGQQISSGWNSPNDGSLGTITITFNINILQSGSNTLTITSSYNSGDYDDFEFNNIYITLSN